MDERVYTMLGDSIHPNAITGCIIWDGEFDRADQPVTGMLGARMRVREMMLKVDKQDLPKGTVVDTTCENNKCVNHEHFQIVTVETATEVAYDEGELSQVKTWIADGRKQEWIAEQLGVSRSKIAKMARVLKDRARASGGTDASHS
jgi:hypothetical protein